MHPEALTSKAKKVFESLYHFPEGGTGLALQLGHCISVYFDFFQEANLPKNFLLKIEKAFKKEKIRVIVNQIDQLGLLVLGVKVSFITYPFPIVLQPVMYKKVKI